MNWESQPSAWDYVRALVCGYPEEQRRRKLVFMLAAYIDDSGNDPGSPVFVLAGYLARAEKWELFSDEWQSVLDIEHPSRLEYLKMNEAYRLNNKDSQFYGWNTEDRDERLKLFCPVINRHVEHGFAVVVPREPYTRLFRNIFSPNSFDRPYLLSFFSIARNIYRIASEMLEGERVDLIFDRQDNEPVQQISRDYDRFAELAPDKVKSAIGRYPIFCDDKCASPLQAADMIAWHIRRYYYELYRDDVPQSGPSNVYLANIFDQKHDLIDVWTEDRLEQLADFLIERKKARIAQGYSVF